jgi:hypothetical protein
MAFPHAWLLLCALPAGAQMDPVPVPAAPAIPIIGALPTLGGRALDFDAGKALAPTLGGATFLRPRGRDAFLRGLEAVARARPKDDVVKAQLQQAIIEDELEQIEPRLRGKELTEERRQEILSQTAFRDVRWYHYFDESVNPDRKGIPDGRHYDDGRIGLFVRRGWYKMPDIVSHFRVLFSHEYTHRLQGEGEVGWRGTYVEIPAYSTELLRALELVGLDGLKAGKLDAVGAGVLGMFEHGRAWTRGTAAASSKDGFYHRGYLAGAAYEIAVTTGRWADAWLYHRLVSAGTDPREAKALILGEASK